MKSRWSDSRAEEALRQYAGQWGEALALRTYSSRLIGAESGLVLHGGGNTSVKTGFTGVTGETARAVYVKKSGKDLACVEPGDHVGLDLAYLERLRALEDLADDVMADELLLHRLVVRSGRPSIEALLHAFLPGTFIDHTHADAILALTNQPDGERIVREALGDDVLVLPYVRPGFRLARAAADACDAAPGGTGLVLMKHGLVTWGETARESYERTIELVSRAEDYIERKTARFVQAAPAVSREEAGRRYREVAPVIRGLIAAATGDQDRPYRRMILQPLQDDATLAFLESDEAKAVSLTPPLTTDHLIRVKPCPLWIDDPAFDDPDALRDQLASAVREYAARYDAYVDRHAGEMAAGLQRFDPLPRVILMPGLGAVCAGEDVRKAIIARDITEHTLKTKSHVAAMGRYEGLEERHVFEMEYFSLQHAKLSREEKRPLAGTVALVTGAAGAIGSAICEELLAAGCHVAATDLPGPRLEELARELEGAYGKRIRGVPVDVTSPESVAEGFSSVIEAWGGIDIVVINAGLAHVSTLAEMDPADFRKLEQVNVEGTLHVLSEAARLFGKQGTGGDVVLISTKNVFAPGAGFGAYSATKAGAHQLARIASLELAELDVRVNMVAPDAVFGHGSRKSGLWAEVGPDRMRARGLDEDGLEEYYRNRNLLKSRVTAVHVARAVLFFVTRRTPTTGVTLPVDGGLPDATPR